MKLGTNEWFEKVNENFEFPTVIAFYVTDKHHVLSQNVDTKAEKITNIKYGKIGPPLLLDGDSAALLGVHKVEDANDYYKLCSKYSYKWKKYK